MGAVDVSLSAYMRRLEETRRSSGERVKRDLDSGSSGYLNPSAVDLSKNGSGQVVFEIRAIPGVRSVTKERPVPLAFPGDPNGKLEESLGKEEIARCYVAQRDRNAEYRIFYQGEDVTDEAVGILKEVSRRVLPTIISTEVSARVKRHEEIRQASVGAYGRRKSLDDERLEFRKRMYGV
ncbi:MAG: hypothetical protein WC796_05690 [Candidatus Pacearchaeota archaeon]|jgi:hypothetical protein